MNIWFCRTEISEWYLKVSKDVCNLKRLEHEDQFDTGIQVVTFNTEPSAPTYLWRHHCFSRNSTGHSRLKYPYIIVLQTLPDPLSWLSKRLASSMACTSQVMRCQKQFSAVLEKGLKNCLGILARWRCSKRMTSGPQKKQVSANLRNDRKELFGNNSKRNMHCIWKRELKCTSVTNRADSSP